MKRLRLIVALTCAILTGALMAGYVGAQNTQYWQAIDKTITALQAQINSIQGNTFPLKGNVAANGYRITNGHIPAASGDVLTEGNPIGAITSAPVTATNLTGLGAVSITGTQTNGADNITSVNGLDVIDARTYGVKCDGTTDNTASGQAAINAICSSKGKLRFPIGTCLYDHWTVGACDGAIIEGAGSKTDGATTTIFKATAGDAAYAGWSTHTTQTACTTSGTSGGFQTLNSGKLILQHLYFDASSGALKSSCALSLVGTTSDTHVKLNDVAFYPSTTPAAGTDPIDIYSSHLTHFQWDDITLGGNASYLWYMGGYSNAGQVNSLLLEGRPIYDIGNFGIVASGNGVNFIGLDSEYQLNALLDGSATGLVNFKYAGDPPINCGVWKPGMTMTAPSNWAATTTTASCVEPVIAGTANAVITGTCTSGSTTISNVTNATPATFWVGLPIHLVGCGASGADLSTRIASISGATLAVDTAPSTSTSGSTAALLIPAYAGHLYIASTAGTSSTTTVPVFPTTAGSTVTDNTGVWTEIGPGAQVQAESYATITASYFGAGNVYIYAPYNTAGGPQILGNVMIAPMIAGVVDGSGGKIVAADSTGNNDSVLYWLGDGTHTVDFDFDIANVVTGVISVGLTDVAYFAPNSRGLFKYNGVWSGGNVADDSGNGGPSLWNYFWNGNFYPATIRGAWSYVTGSGTSATSALLNDVSNHQVVAARNSANNADIQIIFTDSSSNIWVGGSNAAGILLKNSTTLSGGVALASSGGTAPTVSSCGTSPGAVSGTNTAGHVTTGTSATACTVAFSASGAFANAPDCTPVDYSSHSVYLTSAPTTTGFTIGGLTAGDTIGWVCVGH